MRRLRLLAATAVACLTACGSVTNGHPSAISSSPAAAVVGAPSATVAALRRLLLREATRLGDDHPVGMFAVGPSQSDPAYTLIAKGMFHDPLRAPNGRGGVLCLSASARSLTLISTAVGPADLCARTPGMPLDITRPGAPIVSHTVLRTIFLHAAIHCGDVAPTAMAYARTTVLGAYRSVYGTAYSSADGTPANDAVVYVLTGQGHFNCHVGAGGDMPVDHGGPDLTLFVMANDFRLKPWEITYTRVADITAIGHSGSLE